MRIESGASFPQRHSRYILWGRNLAIEIYGEKNYNILD